MKEYIELEQSLDNGTYYIATVEIEYEYINCECSSNCGDEWVTEQWNQSMISDVYVGSVDIYEDGTEVLTQNILTIEQAKDLKERAIEKFLDN